MRKASVFAAAGVMAASLLGMTGAAGAADNEASTQTMRLGPTAAKCYGPPPFDQGRGCFQPKGDHVFAEDTLKDGRGIQVYWKTNYGRSGVCRDSNGTSDGAKNCNYNMKEGKKIKLQIQLTNNGKIVDKSKATGWITI